MELEFGNSSLTDPIRSFKSPAAWNAWLAKHHESSRGVWIKFAKKDSGIKTVTYAEALEVALCFGWIDGQVKRLDERYYLQRFTPRARRSKWSKINCGKAARLIQEGKMRPAGLRQIGAAKADGRWEAAYESFKTIGVPEDLRLALQKHPKALAFFETLKGRKRYSILYRIQDAKRPETRARRIETFVAMLRRGRTPIDP